MADVEPDRSTKDLPPCKRAKTCEHDKELRWSWPFHVDSIANGPHGQCLAITDDNGVQVTWLQLAEASKVVGKELARRGLTGKPTSAYPQSAGQVVVAMQPIVIMMPHTAEGFITVLGVLRQGYPVLPLSVLHGDKKQLKQRYQEAMALFEPAAIISSSPLAQEILEHRPGVQVIPPSELLVDQDPGAQYEDVPTTLDNVLAYVFTSGSTGKSKCVTATNRMAWAEVQWYPRLFQSMGVKIDPRTDRWRQDHEMGWWGAAYFGEMGVSLGLGICTAMMKPNDADVTGRQVTLMGALPSQLQNLYPGARNVPRTLRAVISWAERCEVELGEAWKRAGIKMVDLLIASEYWLTLGSCNLEVAVNDGRRAHIMRPIEGAEVFVLSEELKPLDPHSSGEVTGLLGIGGPQVSPGYAELMEDGTTAIGAGPQSQDAFKSVDGHWLVVPKDLVKQRADGGFLSIGRGGGTVKVKGGVLMATNVVELQLQQRSIAAACITDPVHVEGGSCVVLEMNWEDVWSLKDSLQQASFLRMPTLYVSKMPRNQSTGKVQKALVQAMLEKDFEVERQSKAEVTATQQAQLAWYTQLVRPLLLFSIMQPLLLFSFFQAILAVDAAGACSYLIQFLFEIPWRFCLFAWGYAACSQVANLANSKKFGIWDLTLPVGLVAAGAAPASLDVGLFAGVLLTFTVACGLLDHHLKVNEDTPAGPFTRWRQNAGRLAPAAVVAALPGSFGYVGASVYYALGLLCIFALNRRLPAPPRSLDPAAAFVQRLAATLLSLQESLGYLVCLPVMFGLALPNLILGEYQNYAWSRLARPGQAVTKQQSGWGWSGPNRQLRAVQADVGKDGVIWLDAYEVDDGMTEQEAKPEVQASTPAGTKAQALARQAGVDFQSIDSLRIARLSVLLKKHLHRLPGEEPLEFSELREACVNEQDFVSLVDRRLTLLADTPHFPSSAGSSVNRPTKGRLLTWAQGGAQVHREGATPAPWDCQVDVLFEWTGPGQLQQNQLQAALQDSMHQHPLLRTVPPPDDSTDTMMGGGRSDISTTAAATLALANAVWPEHGLLACCGDALRSSMATALWRCWPRTLVVDHDWCSPVAISMLSEEDASNGHGNIGDNVHDVLGRTWEQWWNPRSMFNICVVTLTNGPDSRQFLYMTTSHKYCDGGAVAAFAHSIFENYEARISGKAVALAETLVLQVQQERLWNYLSGRPCPSGSVDAYFQDINHDTFYHGGGISSGVCFSPRVCDVMRVAGLRMACSEELAWLTCMICALFRLMPDEQLIKILMVHNGRLGDAENVIACTNQYVVLSIHCSNERGTTPLADIASRVKYAVANGKFTRPAPCEQTHAKINIGGMIGQDGNFNQLFRSSRPKKGGRSRAPHVLQLRMDNEGGTWCVKDFKMHQLLEGKTFWEATLCASQEIAQGWFINNMADE